jgi:hypothetical protein
MNDFLLSYYTNFFIILFYHHIKSVSNIIQYLLLRYKKFNKGMRVSEYKQYSFFEIFVSYTYY